MEIKKFLLSIKSKYSGELIYSASSFFAPVIGFMSSFIATAFISPKEMGIMQAALLIPPYFSFLQLGVFNGLNRNVAFYKARNDSIKVQKMVDTSYFVASIVSKIGLIFATLFLVYALLYSDNIIAKIAPVMIIVSLAFAPYSSHMDTTFRSGSDFKLLGQIKFKESFIHFIACLSPIVLGWIGKIIFEIVRPFSIYILRSQKQPIPPVGGFSFSEYKELLTIGFPLLLGGYIYTIFNIADQSAIGYYLSTTDLGNYTIARLVLMTFLIIPTTLSILLYPKASAKYSISRSNMGLRNFFWVSLGLNLLCLLPIAILVYYSLPYLVSTFLPDYVAGIEAAQISIFTGLTFVSSGPSIIMGVVKRNTLYIIAITIALVVFWLFAKYFYQENLNIENIAWLRFYVSFTFSVFLLLFCFYLTTLPEFNE